MAFVIGQRLSYGTLWLVKRCIVTKGSLAYEWNRYYSSCSYCDFVVRNTHYWVLLWCSYYNNNMQCLCSAFYCRSYLEALCILFPLADLLQPSPAQLTGKYTMYTPTWTLQGCKGILSTIVISVYRQALIYGELRHNVSLLIAYALRRTVLMSQLAYAGLEPTMLWLIVWLPNHSAIATRLFSIHSATVLFLNCPPFPHHLTIFCSTPLPYPALLTPQTAPIITPCYMC